MRSELDHVLRDRSFMKSPTLSKLLAYLVFETLNGTSDKLKSYTVAVDCLGKPQDFDPQTDSYPRVQTMRLRNLLEAFYAKHPPANELCLYMVAGSYRIRIGNLETAYPELFRPLSASRAPLISDMDRGEPHQDRDAAETVIHPPADIDAGIGRGTAIGHAVLVAFAAIGLFAASYFLLASLRSQTPSAHRPPAINDVPIVMVDMIHSPGDEASKAAAADIFAKLADGIRRSWAVRVRLQSGSQMSEPTDSVRFRLETRLGEVHGGERTLYLRLTEGRSSDLVWSQTAAMNGDRPLSESLGPTIAQLASPFGVIASREMERSEGKQLGEYGCLLRYLSHLRTQEAKVLPALTACLARPYENDRLNAVRLALLSFLTLETSAPQTQEQSWLKAKSFAEESIAADPSEAYAHFALARLQYGAGNCVTGNVHTKSAVDANPYDPVILGVLGNFASECGFEGSDLLVERAFALRSPSESFARLSLILASIRDGHRDRLVALSSDANGVRSNSPAYHYLCETLIAAALDQPELARENWRLFAKASGNTERSADEMLSQIIISPVLRMRVIAYLDKQGILVSKPIDYR